MPKSEGQKLKLLYILDMLMKNTDETHKMTTQDLIDGLAAQGIKAERKSIYDDIRTLTDYGIDIISVGGKGAGYYVASRDFELAELKILVDSIQASKFITKKKSRELIRKISKLASHYEASQLNRQVVITNRNKTINENIYYNVDMLYNGIAANRQVSFQYLEWSTSKKMKMKKNGEYYQVSPWALSWDDENYYLIAYDSEAGMIKHYRVDKMIHLSVTDVQREGKDSMDEFDLAGYSSKTFGMYAGEDETVVLICEQSMTGVLIDRFGKNIPLRQEDETHIRARIKVAVSRQFFGWVCGLGGQVRIAEPDYVVSDFCSYLDGIRSEYKN